MTIDVELYKNRDASSTSSDESDSSDENATVENGEIACAGKRRKLPVAWQRRDRAMKKTRSDATRTGEERQTIIEEV